MRGDPEHKPVEWHWFNGLATPVRYVAESSLFSVDSRGMFYSSGQQSDYDLIPIPSPPQIVPWESPDDVPDGIWLRVRDTGVFRRINGISVDGIDIGNGNWRSWSVLLADYEYHTDRRATDGWQPCGKAVK